MEKIQTSQLYLIGTSAMALYIIIFLLKNINNESGPIKNKKVKIAVTIVVIIQVLVRLLG